MDVSPRARLFVAITLLAVTAFLVVALSTSTSSDWPFRDGASVRTVRNLSGPLGSLLAWGAFHLFGRAMAWLVPLLLATMAVSTVARGANALRRWLWKTAALTVLLGAFFALTPVTRNLPALRGRLGDAVAGGLSAVLGEIGSSIVVVAVILLVSLGELGAIGRGLLAAARSVRSIGGVGRSLAGLGARLRWWVSDYAHALRERVEEEPEIHGTLAEDDDEDALATAGAAVTGEWEEAPAPRREAGPRINSAVLRPRRAPGRAPARTPKRDVDDEKKPPLEEASLPPLSLLDQGGEGGATFSREELRNWSTVLEDKLRNYGVEGKVTAVHHGPVVTTFEFEPAPGVRIKEIVSRSDDLALVMRARSLRMIAPIPGRAAVGIEIPNPKSRMVYLYDVLNEVSERQRLGGIMIALGVDVVGEPFLMNLCEAPHLLIAGTTGSGKSVCLNTIIASVLFQYRPSDVRLLLVDPKMVEMSMYNGIPHLLHPVITDPKEAAKVLEFLVAEMGRRNELFQRHGVRNIESFNSKLALGRVDTDDGEPREPLPYIVVIVDELGDLALAKGVDIETLLARLAQMARAAGIHMVLATQRPSVDVIVGKTKANFPTRIAFRVATKVDSRTILDTIGADKLLGKGDMLYADARNPVPLRLHGAWVSEREIEEIIRHWKSYRFDAESLDLHAERAGGASFDDNVDPLFDDARGVVFQYRQGSTSLLQRKLHVGYARAARLLDQLEQAGIVGPPDGSKPREVFLESAERRADDRS